MIKAFRDTNKVLLTCIHDIVKGVVNVTDLECCEDSMVKLLQEWGGGVGQTFKLDNVGGWKWNPVDGLKHHPGQGGPGFRHSLQTSFYWHDLVPHHFCVSSSRHIYKVLSILLRDTLWNIQMQCSTDLNAFPDSAFTFLDKTNWFVYTTMLSNHRNAHSLPTYPICSIPITETPLTISSYINLYVSIYILLSRHNKHEVNDKVSSFFQLVYI